MPVKYQGGTPKKIYHGSDLVEAIFYGGTQIWPTHPNLPAVTGAYALSGKVAVLRRARKLIAAAGTYSGGVAYSFNMTAADYFGSVQGFSDGGLFDAFGSIDAEPIPGHDCVALYYASAFSAVICFEGDVTAMLAGRTAWIDGVEYPFTQDWQYGEEDGNYTIAGWDTGKPVFVAGSSYFVEIK
jgi:hypothetical protein